MGKWALPTGEILSLRLQKGPRSSDFSGAAFATNVVPEKVEQERSTRGKEKINANPKIFNFRKNDYNLAVDSHF